MADDTKLRLAIWEAAADFFDDKIDANHPDYVTLERAFDTAIDALIAAVRAEMRQCQGDCVIRTPYCRPDCLGHPPTS